MDETIVPLTVFGVYAVALALTAAVCYRYRHEIFM
jgi:hypothetical protein